MARRWLRSSLTVLALLAPIASGAVAQRPAIKPRPAADSDYVHFESDIVVALNQARTNPAAFAKTIEALLPAFHDNEVEFPGSYSVIRTTEGDTAVREAIRALAAMKPIAAVKLDAGLSHAARDHALDQGKTGQVEHIGSDGSTPEVRAEKYGRQIGALEEILSYAPIGLSGLQIIQALVIDDGVIDRGHRHTIFNPNMHVVGVSCGPHPIAGTVCVLDFVGDYKPWSAPLGP